MLRGINIQSSNPSTDEEVDTQRAEAVPRSLGIHSGARHKLALPDTKATSKRNF